MAAGGANLATKCFGSSLGFQISCEMFEEQLRDQVGCTSGCHDHAANLQASGINFATQTTPEAKLLLGLATCRKPRGWRGRSGSTSTSSHGGQTRSPSGGEERTGALQNFCLPCLLYGVWEFQAFWDTTTDKNSSWKVVICRGCASGRLTHEF